MKRVCCLILLLVVCFKLSFAQQGKDGAKTIAANDAVVNEYTTLTANAVAAGTSITVSNNNLNTNGRFSSALSAGDLIMIIQMQGATINGTATDSTWGTITGYGNCGLYEFAQVQSVSGTTIINLQCPLQNSYTSSGRVQVVRVPRFSSLIIDAGDTLTCDPWEGNGTASGGIIAVEVKGNTIVNGAISATAYGFRGGATQNMPSGTTFSTIYYSTSGGYAYGAQKGESIAGYQNDYTAYGGMYCRGAPANGGGGGNVWNCSGGGGANAGNGVAYTGDGNPDISNNNYITAWNLEYAGFANSTSSGGGRGGYAASQNDLDPTQVGPDNSAWGGGFFRENAGGKGGRPLTYSTGRLFLGGGGGAGEEDNNSDDNLASDDGNGGGLIYITSYGTISGGGSIISNGQQGRIDNSVNNPNDGGYGDGCGGGGGGGTIVLQSDGAISGINIYANGGPGGNQYISQSPLPYEAEGGGGGGSGGYIVTSNNGVPTSVLGGKNGVTNSVTMPSFPPDGGTAGGNGDDTVIPFCVPQISAISGPTMICPDKNYTYSVATTCGNPSYTWALPVGWSGTSTTNSIIITAGSTGGTISVSINSANCPPLPSQDTSLAVTVISSPMPPALPRDTVVCGAINTILLSAGSTGSRYLWSTGDTTASTTITDTGTYWVLVFNSCDTLPADSITITQKLPPTVSLGKDTTICNFTNFVLNPVIKSDTTITSYLWSTGAITPILPVATAGTYWVQVTNDCGSASDTVIINSCESGYVVPNAFTPGGENANAFLGLLKTGNGIITLQYFRIYNRWGQLIFSTNDDQAKWDGTFNGLPEPLGVYVYVVDYNDSFGVNKLLKGNITLLR